MISGIHLATALSVMLHMNEDEMNTELPQKLRGMALNLTTSPISSALFEAADRLSEQQQVIDEMTKALESAIEGYEDGSQYKGDYLRDKHGDADDIARLRATLSRAKGHTKGAE